MSKLERKQQQIEHAAHASDKAKLVKYADKIANLRDITNSPPQYWSLERRQGYFDWAKQVVDQLNGSNANLEKLFMVEFGQRPIQ